MLAVGAGSYVVGNSRCNEHGACMFEVISFVYVTLRHCPRGEDRCTIEWAPPAPAFVMLLSCMNEGWREDTWRRVCVAERFVSRQEATPSADLISSRQPSWFASAEKGCRSMYVLLPSVYCPACVCDLVVQVFPGAKSKGRGRHASARHDGLN